jgi:hypothetical protein
LSPIGLRTEHEQPNAVSVLRKSHGPGPILGRNRSLVIAKLACAAEFCPLRLRGLRRPAHLSKGSVGIRMRVIDEIVSYADFASSKWDIFELDGH